ncbi:MAG: GNAT family N-acetyltransferase [Planctomycetota bacterium]
MAERPAFRGRTGHPLAYPPPRVGEADGQEARLRQVRRVPDRPDSHSAGAGGSAGVHPEHRKHGYATQAVRLLIDKLFNSQPAHRIQAHCLATNTASQRVLEGAGMTCEATLRGLAFSAGQYRDVSLYSILRPEWCDTSSYAARFGGL